MTSRPANGKIIHRPAKANPVAMSSAIQEMQQRIIFVVRHEVDVFNHASVLKLVVILALLSSKDRHSEVLLKQSASTNFTQHQEFINIKQHLLYAQCDILSQLTIGIA